MAYLFDHQAFPQGAGGPPRGCRACFPKEVRATREVAEAAQALKAAQRAAEESGPGPDAVLLWAEVSATHARHHERFQRLKWIHFKWQQMDKGFAWQDNRDGQCGRVIKLNADGRAAHCRAKEEEARLHPRPRLGAASAGPQTAGAPPAPAAGAPPTPGSDAPSAGAQQGPGGQQLTMMQQAQRQPAYVTPQLQMQQPQMQQQMQQPPAAHAVGAPPPQAAPLQPAVTHSWERSAREGAMASSRTRREAAEPATAAPATAAPAATTPGRMLLELQQVQPKQILLDRAADRGVPLEQDGLQQPIVASCPSEARSSRSEMSNSTTVVLGWGTAWEDLRVLSACPKAFRVNWLHPFAPQSYTCAHLHACCW